MPFQRVKGIPPPRRTPHMRTAAKPISRRALLTWTFIVALTQLAAAGISARAADGSAGPATKLTTSRTRDAAIGRMEEFYAKIYGEPLDSAERLPREIAIVSLSRIDAAPITERLLDGLQGEGPGTGRAVPGVGGAARPARVALARAAPPVGGGGAQGGGGGAFPGATATPLLLALASTSRPRSVTSRRSSPCAWCGKTTSANRPAARRSTRCGSWWRRGTSRAWRAC